MPVSDDDEDDSAFTNTLLVAFVVAVRKVASALSRVRSMLRSSGSVRHSSPTDFTRASRRSNSASTGASAAAAGAGADLAALAVALAAGAAGVLVTGGAALPAATSLIRSSNNARLIRSRTMGGGTSLARLTFTRPATALEKSSNKILRNTGRNSPSPL